MLVHSVHLNPYLLMMLLLDKIFTAVIEKKALHLIYKDGSAFCDLEPETVANHYSTISSDPPTNIEFIIEKGTAASPININRFTKLEVSKRLKSCEDTSPGPDGITFKHLKLIDPTTSVLTPMYNCYLKFQAVLSLWKKTTTILIYKKGNR